MMNRESEDLGLEGKTAIITGASRGIGKAVAIGFANMGANVVVSSRRQEAVDALASEIREMGGTASGVKAHMGQVEDIEALVTQTENLYGGVDILVNNAATNPVFGPLLDADEKAFDKIMEVNVKGPLLLSQRVFPIMEKRGGGSMIQISSIGGVSPEPLLGLYSASKAALISLTKAMAKEWGAAGVRVNALCPGLVRTRFSAAIWQDPEILEASVGTQALPRMAEPEEIVGLAIFLASNASSYCTGGVFMADGGHTI
jgi:dehydrogenase/reductase SDR family member 4